MKKTYSFNYMMDNCGCYGKSKTAELFFSENKNDISIENILNSDIPLKDKYWFVVRKTELTKLEKQTIAIDVAEIVLPIYEKRYPNSKAPREAIEAAKQFLGGHISLDILIEKRAAAYAAAYAADAAAAAADDVNYKKQLTDYLNNFISNN
jgi:hypothetical protein